MPVLIFCMRGLLATSHDVHAACLDAGLDRDVLLHDVFSVRSSGLGAAREGVTRTGFEAGPDLLHERSPQCPPASA